MNGYFSRSVYIPYSTEYQWHDIIGAKFWKNKIKAGGGGCPLENHFNLRRSNIDLQPLLSLRENKISDYSGIKM